MPTDPIEPIEKRSFAELVAERLIMGIAGGQFPPGQRLVEQDIAERLGVSRVPVREAIQQLATHGILEPAGGKGLRVARFDERQLEEIYQIRVLLEQLMLPMAMARIRERPALIAGLDRHIQEMGEAAARNDYLAINHIDLAFHRHALTLADHALGLRIWEGISRHFLIIFGMEIYRDPDLHAVVQQHVELRDVLHAGGPAALGPVIEHHICGYRSLLMGKQHA